MIYSTSKIKFFLCSIAFLILSNITMAQSGNCSSPENIKIVSQNVGWLNGPVPTFAGEEDNMALYLANNHADADVIVLQEAFDSPAVFGFASTFSALTNNQYEFTNLDDATNGILPFDYGHGIIIFSKHPIIVSQSVEFPICSGLTSCDNDCLAAKGFVATLIDFGGGNQAYVMGTHLDAGNGNTGGSDCNDFNARHVQIGFINNYINSGGTFFGNHNLPWIIVGDLNIDTRNGNPNLNNMSNNLPVSYVNNYEYIKGEFNAWASWASSSTDQNLSPSFTSPGSGTLLDYFLIRNDYAQPTCHDPSTYSVNCSVVSNGFTDHCNISQTFSFFGNSSTSITPASVPYCANFNSSTLDPHWSALSSSSNGRIQTTTSFSPRSGRHLTMDVINNGSFSTNEAVLAVNLAGQSNVELDFWWKEFNDEPHSQDGVYFSDDGGSSYTKVHNLTGGSSTYQNIVINISNQAAIHGLSLNNNFRIKFQQHDNYSISTDGFAFDDICVSTVSAGCSLSLSETALLFPAAGSSDSFNVSSNGNWSISQSGSWFSLSTNSGNQNGFVSVSASANTSSTPRSGTITVTCGSTTQTITIGQAGVSGGGTYATVPYCTNFNSGLDQYWSTSSSTSRGRIQTTSSHTPISGSHLTMDVTTSGSFNTNEALLNLNLAGASNVDLEFWWKEFGDETHSQDGVYLSNNGGSTFTKVYNLTGGTSSYQNIVLDISSLAASNGLSLTSNFVIKFQQYDNYPMLSDGFAFDEVCVSSGSGSGPGNPGPTTYCNSSGNNSSYEWIETVLINGYSNNSGDNGGYANFTSLSLPTISAGSSLPLTISPGFSSTTYTEYYTVFIDLNSDGDFNDSGESKDFGSGTSAVSNSILIPSNTTNGSHRVRVTMKYSAYPTSCETFSYGEVEDYTIVVINGLKQDPSIQSEELAEIEFSIFPNPADHSFTLSSYQSYKDIDLKLFDISGRVVKQLSFAEFESELIDVTDLIPGLYNLRIKGRNFTRTEKIVIR